MYFSLEQGDFSLIIITVSITHILLSFPDGFYFSGWVCPDRVTQLLNRKTQYKLLSYSNRLLIFRESELRHEHRVNCIDSEVSTPFPVILNNR